MNKNTSAAIVIVANLTQTVEQIGRYLNGYYDGLQATDIANEVDYVSRYAAELQTAVRNIVVDAAIVKATPKAIAHMSLEFFDDIEDNTDRDVSEWGAIRIATYVAQHPEIEFVFIGKYLHGALIDYHRISVKRNGFVSLLSIKVAVHAEIKQAFTDLDLD